MHERWGDGERERETRPSKCLPRDFSSPSLYQHPSQSAAREKINFLLPDYIIRFRLKCRLNISYQHFPEQVIVWRTFKAGPRVERGSPAA